MTMTCVKRHFPHFAFGTAWACLLSYCLEVISVTKCCWHCCWHCWFNWSFMTKPNRVWAVEKHKQPESTHRPKQRKRLHGTLMINQRRSHNALFDCVVASVVRSTSWMRLSRQHNFCVMSAPDHFCHHQIFQNLELVTLWDKNAKTTPPTSSIASIANTWHKVEKWTSRGRWYAPKCVTKGGIAVTKASKILALPGLA